MPYAICTKPECPGVEHYRNTRGSRLADFKCRICGSALRAAAVVNGQPVAREGHRGPRTMIDCPLCGKRRVSGGSGVKTLKQETCFDVQLRWRSLMRDIMVDAEPPKHIAVPAGTEVCWHHEPTYPINLYREEANG